MGGKDNPPPSVIYIVHQQKGPWMVHKEYQLEENDPETGYEYSEGLVFVMAG
jgi:hypothetical protein